MVSSKRSALGLARSRRAGIPTLVLEKSIDWDLVYRELNTRKISRIFLLGFMKVVPAAFIDKWSERPSRKIWNLHPSLLPKFPGLKGFEKSFEAESDVGATVHQVTARLDAGPIVKQKISVKHSQKSTLEHAQMRNSLIEQRLVQNLAIVAGPL